MSGIITLTTDFGLRDAYQGAVKGAILSLCPGVSLVDITHLVPPGDILEGSLVMAGACSLFPDGVVHVGVVDPGVGTERRAVVLETARHFFVGPDNGLLTLVAPPEEVKTAVRLTNPAYFAAEVSPTFHGRDVFAPVAAHLCLGVGPRAMGEEMDPESLVRLDLPEAARHGESVTGEVVHVDAFGNLITNIRGADVCDGSVVGVEGQSLALVRTYADVEQGAVVALIGSTGLVEVAVNGGNAAEKLGAGKGCRVSVVPGAGP